jgi:hypothetical protein
MKMLMVVQQIKKFPTCMNSEKSSPDSTSDPILSQFNQFYFSYMHFNINISVVGIATRYGLDGPGMESRWG